MPTDVNKAIFELLFEKNAVIVPGLGGFTSTASPASVDYVQDVITPPTAKLDFNPNLVINDGTLVHFLQKNNTSTYQEAEKLVEQFVNDVRETLDRREIFEIPKVGRLYQDYEQKIRFMPEGTNFNVESFGLPAIEFQPLTKEKPKHMTTPPRPADFGALAEEEAAAAPVADEPPGSLMMKILPWAVLLLAILMALLLYNIFSQPSKPVAELPEAKERINVKPSLPEETKPAEPAGSEGTDAATTTPPTTGAPSAPATSQPSVAEQKNTPPKASSVPDGADTEQDNYEPTKQKIYLVVHSFGVKSNATKFAQTLTEDGYSTETKKYGKLFRVGVNFAYDTKADIEKMRRELATKYKAGPKTEKELEEMGQ